MRKTLDTTPTLYAPERAEEIAAALNANPDDLWTYAADHDPTGEGYSRVAAYDEAGEFVAYVNL